MKEYLVSGITLPHAYHQALEVLYYLGDITDCPDYNQKQKELSMTIHVEKPTCEPRISRCMIGGFRELQQYEMEVLDGILDFKIGDGKAWEYTYHQRYKHQLPFIIDELKRNPYSRRAVMNIRDFQIDSNNSHAACLQSIQYFIRDGKLDCCVLMRSNDATQACFMNAFAFIRLQEKVAKELGVEVGSYTHRANSFHCYEKDFLLLGGYINRITSGMNTTYDYRDFFKELMEESIPSILQQVQILKNEMRLVN